MSIIKLSYEGNYDGVLALLEENPDSIREVDEFGHSALFGAVIYKRYEVCKLLIERGANVNEQSKQFGFTVLHKACLVGSMEICHLLVSNGANVALKDQKDSDALYNAITGAGDLIMCKYLVEHSQDAEGVLHLACFNGKLAVVEWLLNEHLNSIQEVEQNTTRRIRGLDGVNAKGYRGNTPLHLACQQGHYELCKLLVRRGADVRAVNEVGCTPLHEAVLAENASLITALLIKHGADINAKDFEDRAPLHKASSMGHVDHCKALIDIGANLHILDQSKCQSDHSNNKSPLKGAVGVGDSALHCAITSGNIDMCTYLLDRGIDINIKSATGKPIVHFACHHKKYKLVSLLVTRGADVNALDYKQIQIPTTTPVAPRKQMGSFSPPTRRKSEVHVLSITYSETALQAAAQSGNTEACKVLIQNSADVSIADEVFGNTALHLACFEGFTDICELLIQSNADIHGVNRYFDSESDLNREDTPLHIAAAQGHLDICMLLIQSGADFSTLNRHGDHCIAQSDHAIKRLLIHFCIKHNPELAHSIGVSKSASSPLHPEVKLPFTPTLEPFWGTERVWKQRKVRFSIRKNMFKQTVWDVEIMEVVSAPGHGAFISTIYSTAKKPILIPLLNMQPVELDVVHKSGYDDLRIVFQEEGAPFPVLKLGFGRDRQRRTVWRNALKKHIENGK